MITTGHGLYKRHLRHWNDLESFLCELCEEAWEDPWHLWDLCPVLDDSRNQSVTQLKAGVSWERVLITFFRTPRIQELVAHNEALLCPD